jgi:hemerythrin-like domain-containing protein
MKTALKIIRVEHRTLAAVLHSLRYLVDGVREGRREPDFTVFRAIVYYMDSFPEKLHHPKEDHYLFTRLRQRTTMANSALDQLEAEHVLGAKLIRDLEQALLRWEMGGQQNFAMFDEEVKRYEDFQWRHMQQEEESVLPLAERVLTDEDWSEIDAAFASNADPLIAKETEKDFEQLLKRIVSITAPPSKVGHEN